MKILLLSGGIDSTAIAHWLRPDIAYTIDYGQLAAPGEIRAATEICRSLGILHKVFRCDCSSVGSGELCGRAAVATAPSPNWWPFRNQLLVTIAGTAALMDGGTELWLGSVASDVPNSDGCERFFEDIDRLMRCQIGGLRVSAPAVRLSSCELVRQSGISPQLLYWTHSCHVAPFACGRCRGCIKRAEVVRVIPEMSPLTPRVLGLPLVE